MLLRLLLMSDLCAALCADTMVKFLWAPGEVSGAFFYGEIKLKMLVPFCRSIFSPLIGEVREGIWLY